MKKILLLLILFSVGLLAQSNLTKLPERKLIRGSAVDLNGTDEYMSKSSPSKLDLNGTERITTQTNRDFETSVGDWVAVGSAAIQKDGTQKKSGSYALQVVTNGEWSGAELPYTSFTALTADANGIYEKYTKEFWVYNESADTVQVVIGDKSIKRNIPATTWTKFVYNFQITASTIDQNIQVLWKTTGKTNYIDDVSLTKAWDVLVNMWWNTGASAGNERLLVFNSSYANAFYITSSNTNSFAFTDNTTTATISSANYISANVTYLSSLTINRIGDGQIYAQGIASGSAVSVSAVGKLNPISTLFVGVSQSAGNYFSGQIGEVQIIRFTDISQSNVSATTLTQAYRLGIPKTWTGGSPEVVAHYKFRGSTDGTMLQDYSGNGNNLTGTNVTTADQVKGNYPTR